VANPSIVRERRTIHSASAHQGPRDPPQVNAIWIVIMRRSLIVPRRLEVRQVFARSHGPPAPPRYRAQEGSRPRRGPPKKLLPSVGSDLVEFDPFDLAFDNPEHAFSCPIERQKRHDNLGASTLEFWVGNRSHRVASLRGSCEELRDIADLHRGTILCCWWLKTTEKWDQI